MRLLLTGGAGYIGSTLCRLLLGRGDCVTVLDTLEHAEASLPVPGTKGLEIIRGDVRDLSTLEGALRGVDAVVHLAALSGHPACDRDPERATSVNVEGTRALARATGGSRPLVFASTGSVYGVVPSGMCTEETPPAPASHYARTKLEAERAVLDVAGGVVLRFATCYGVSPRMRPDLLVNHFVGVLSRGEELAVYEPEARRTFLHVRDAALAIALIVDKTVETAGRIWNVGDETQNRTKRRVLELIAREIPGAVIRYSAPGRDPDRRDYAVSYARIRALGFGATVSLEAGIHELVTELSGR